MKAAMFSNTATTVVRAAKLMNRKKRAPQNVPPASWLKMLGSVTKIRPGPAPGFTPNAKQAGKMMKPDISAAKVSRPMMLIHSPVRLLDLSI